MLYNQPLSRRWLILVILTLLIQLAGLTALAGAEDAPRGSENIRGPAVNRPGIFLAADREQKRLPERHLNKTLKNINIMFIGTAGKRLEMVSVYSIDPRRQKSGAVFFPGNTNVGQSQPLTLATLYRKGGTMAVRRALAKKLELSIPYYVQIDERFLKDFAALIEPVYVDNREVDIPGLFRLQASPRDEQILGALAKEVTAPRMWLKIPRLIHIFLENVRTNLNTASLVQLYRIAIILDKSVIRKLIAPGNPEILTDGREVWKVGDDLWPNILYTVTR